MKAARITKKIMWSLAAVGGLTVALYAFACIYIWMNQTRFIFMPQRDITQTPADIGLEFEDVYLPVPATHGNGRERMHCWWIPNKDSTGRYLIYLHGSAFNIGANVNHARRFRNLGFSVLLISYRGYGRSEGDFPTETRVYADAEAAWNYLVTQKK